MLLVPVATDVAIPTVPAVLLMVATAGTEDFQLTSFVM